MVEASIGIERLNIFVKPMGAKLVRGISVNNKNCLEVSNRRVIFPKVDFND